MLEHQITDLYVLGIKTHSSELRGQEACCVTLHNKPSAPPLFAC